MAVILLAGGVGARMGAGVNKVLLSIAGREILDYSLDTLTHSDMVSTVVVVVHPDDRQRVESLIEAHTTAPDAGALSVMVADGGDSRHQSEFSGLCALRGVIESDQIDVVAIHDGARPFMTVDLLERVAVAATSSGGAIPGVEVAEPLYSLDTDHLIQPEEYIWAQTPQAFLAKPLLAAYDSASAAGFEGADTAETITRYCDNQIQVVAGDPLNIKVTFAPDIPEAETIAKGWSNGTWTDR